MEAKKKRGGKYKSKNKTEVQNLKGKSSRKRGEFTTGRKEKEEAKNTQHVKFTN